MKLVISRESMVLIHGFRFLKLFLTLTKASIRNSRVILFTCTSNPVRQIDVEAV